MIKGSSASSVTQNHVPWEHESFESSAVGAAQFSPPARRGIVSHDKGSR